MFNSFATLLAIAALASHALAHTGNHTIKLPGILDDFSQTRYEYAGAVLDVKSSSTTIKFVCQAFPSTTQTSTETASGADYIGKESICVTESPQTLTYGPSGYQLQQLVTGATIRNDPETETLYTRTVSCAAAGTTSLSCSVAVIRGTGSVRRTTSTSFAVTTPPFPTRTLTITSGIERLSSSTASPTTAIDLTGMSNATIKAGSGAGRASVPFVVGESAFMAVVVSTVGISAGLAVLL